MYANWAWFCGVSLTCNSEVLAPFITCCSGLCALPLLAHAVGETTAQPSGGVPIRSAGLLCASTQEAKGGLGCDRVCRFLVVFVCFLFMWAQGQSNKILAGNLGVFSVWLETAWGSLHPQDVCSADSERHFTFQGCLQSLLPREKILEWKDKLKIYRLTACDS